VRILAEARAVRMRPRERDELASPSGAGAPVCERDGL